MPPSRAAPRGQNRPPSLRWGSRRLPIAGLTRTSSERSATYAALPASNGWHGARAGARIGRSDRAAWLALTIQIVAKRKLAPAPSECWIVAFAIAGARGRAGAKANVREMRRYHTLHGYPPRPRDAPAARRKQELPLHDLISSAPWVSTARDSATTGTPRFMDAAKQSTTPLSERRITTEVGQLGRCCPRGRPTREQRLAVRRA